ncbi:hypothetical protein J2S49_000745 [Arcanobacterium wilhelmae]|uniref:DUF3618 domain-containing protein n=1 Tax=Arcanobacterium wilhelmae TaxID=1803177 RepID=A0ABT9NAC5_9ACTO|nr:DUF3618 domain-containing protein [Arcanobacterium wilhelmae]MDP9800669.1 hypothetical protein [Arcanobacterium wilhelmae]WFN90071.1 DUF3618 domain-containing protein [Arcanobacterium wilhelmae]
MTEAANKVQAAADAARKSAKDYEVHNDAPDNRTPEQIEKDMQRVREEMTATVNELAAKLDPKRLGEDAKAAAFAKVDEAKAKATGLVDDAKNGDRKAIAILAAAGTVVLGLVARAIFKK